ncbi:hypothetical protein IEO21_00133 [Rhodonia placenta]|uniref:Uncharacterized protein n=1 Tax=Rhodonia placenta TaxID=104341 RepID=A0A8H7PC49_9APHY|nr:hypothetical protein IEO21_00133 [Postia placenta]
MALSADPPPPPADLRRAVTGHDDCGTACVRSDDLLPSSESPTFPGVWGNNIWVTKATPTGDNNSDVDGAARQPDSDLGIVMRNGTVLRYTDLAPGALAAMTSSLDYNILIQGKLVLIMEDGTETKFETPGDIVIQRGTMHAWKNPGPGWARWVTVLVDAKPAVMNGIPLPMEVRR